MRTAGIHHVGLVTADAGRTEQFYGEVLGLDVVRRAVDARAAAAGPALVVGPAPASPGTLLVFEESRDGRSGRWGVGGVHHVALGTATRAALLMWKRRLVDLGAAVTGPYDRGWFHSIYFRDPDGQILEIATRGPGYALDEPADRLGEREIVPAEARLRGQRDERAIAAETHAEPVERIVASMELDGIHHITGITDDIEAAHAFYTERLGLRLVKRTVNQDDARTPHWFWARYDGGAVAAHSTYTLFGWKGSTYGARAGVGQTRSIAFRAVDDDALVSWRAALLGSGVEAGAMVDRGFARAFEFRAPDGQLLELATDGPGFGA
jgi:glyoxalase family protein